MNEAVTSLEPLANPAASPSVSRALLNANQEQRRQQLIAATIRIIARNGMSHTTLAKVAQEASLSPGIVNFYFTSKDQLLLAVLRSLSDEFMSRLEGAIAASGVDAGANLEALIDAMLAPDLCDADKVAVWYAFWGEARARGDYLKACGERDEAYQRALTLLCRQIGEAAPDGAAVDSEAVALALLGLLDQLWQDIMVRREAFDRRAARRLCQGYLASAFPWRFTLPGPDEHLAEVVDLPLTLPSWTYGNWEFFQLERERIFRRAWHIVGHVSDVPDAGDYLTFDFLGERAFVIRGKDGQLRAFHNVCRHRAHAVVSGDRGSCANNMIRCPYHGWLYNLDGRLRAVAAEKSFQGVEKQSFGLQPVEMEIFMGFVFIRFEGGEDSVAQRFAPYEAEMRQYRTDEMKPVLQLWTQEIDVDWKNVMDNYLEGYHVPASHPGLFDLFGSHYEVEATNTGTGRALHWMRDEAARGWSTRAYQHLLPTQDHLPEDRRRAWVYYSLLPLVSFDFYPDCVDFFQVIPLDAGRTLLRSGTYALPTDDRNLKAARWLNWRINTQVQREDEELTRSVQAGLSSSAYSVGVLSEKEAMVRAFHEWVRGKIAAARQIQAPAEGSVSALNTALETSF